MANSMRGDGFLRAHQALDSLLDDPERLRRSCEGQMQRDLLRWGLEAECAASEPFEQFLAQYSEETERLGRDSMYQCPPGFDNITKHAQFKVKMRWIEQDIWRDEWSSQHRFAGRWKHEEPLPLPEPDSESDANSDSAPVMELFGTVAIGKRPARSHKVGHREQRQREQLRQREASRPYFQFLSQLSDARNRIQEELALYGPLR